MGESDGKNFDFDVLIVGAGPAGLSAGIWCADIGLRAAVIEREAEAGGQLLSIFNPINNYPGVVSPDGKDLRDRFLAGAEGLGSHPILATEIVEFDGPDHAVVDNNDRRYTAAFFIFATGVRRRKLNIPGEEQFAGKGIIGSGWRERKTVRGKIVAIVGGGDAALENSMILSDYAEKVYVIHRRQTLTARDSFIREALADAKIEFVLDSTVTAITGKNSVSSIQLRDRSGMITELPVDAVLLRIGFEPNSELLRKAVDLDANGYVIVDNLGRTSLSHIYAIGDLANPISPTIATATGTAATAVKCALVAMSDAKAV